MAVQLPLGRWLAWGTGRPGRALLLTARGGHTIGGFLILLGGFRLLTNAPFDGAWLLILGWFIFETAQDSAAEASEGGRLPPV